MIEIKLTDLRVRLHDITNSIQNISDHPAIIDRLKTEFPHSIRVAQEANPNEPCSNCHVYAFGTDYKVIELVSSLALTDMHVGLKFISESLLPILIEIKRQEATTGDYILYFEGEVATHSGILRGRRINSKWGQGHVYDHEVEEVPASYGCYARFYSTIPDGLATKRFVEYVKSHPDYGAVQEFLKEWLPSYF